MIVRASSEVGVGPCITVELDPGYADLQMERIGSAIGSANPGGTDRGLHVRCALSVTNFKKIKELYPGAKLSQDERTRHMVAELQAKKQAYDLESSQGAKVKAGNLDGIKLPDYEFKLPPYKHQVLGWQFLHALSAPALFAGCGLGKTYISGTWADSLIKAGEEWIFLVFCPVNIIKHAWLADLAKFTDLNPVRLHEPSSSKTKEKRAARFATDGDIYIINPESAIRNENDLLALLRRHRKKGKKLGFIIDESSKIKNSNSKSYKLSRKVRVLADRCIIMTGTPSPNGVGDLWAQFSILDEGMTLQPKYGDYRLDTHNSFTMKGVTYTVGNGPKAKKVLVNHWAPKAGIATKVHNWIEPRMIRFRAEDCLDLPKAQFLRRDVPMSGEQAKLYKEMSDFLYTQFEEEDITARIAVSRLMKLREITGGFIITDKPKRSTKAINKDAPKMLELDLMLDQILGRRLGDEGLRPTKALVWAQYQWECQTLTKRYKKYGARGLFGGISQTAREDNLSAFKEDDECQILVCHPASAGHGLTLTEANYAFYYSLSYNYDEFHQSAHRIARPGQTRPMFFYFLVTPNSIEDIIIKALENKQSISDTITDGPFRRRDIETLAALSSTGGQQLNITLSHE